jgi:hypothetical protein
LRKIVPVLAVETAPTKAQPYLVGLTLRSGFRDLVAENSIARTLRSLPIGLELLDLLFRFMKVLHYIHP